MGAHLVDLPGKLRREELGLHVLLVELLLMMMRMVGISIGGRIRLGKILWLTVRERSLGRGRGRRRGRGGCLSIRSPGVRVC